MARPMGPVEASRASVFLFFFALLTVGFGIQIVATWLIGLL